MNNKQGRPFQQAFCANTETWFFVLFLRTINKVLRLGADGFLGAWKERCMGYMKHSLQKLRAKSWWYDKEWDKINQLKKVQRNLVSTKKVVNFFWEQIEPFLLVNALSHKLSYKRRSSSPPPLPLHTLLPLPLHPPQPIPRPQKEREHPWLTDIVFSICVTC